MNNGTPILTYMNPSIEEIIASRKNWFKDWFNSEFYHKLYAHRNEREAAEFVTTLIDELQPSLHSDFLDLGCGNGRHAKHLASRGYNVTGLDLAFSSIQHARKWETENLRFYKHDMREPFGTNCFDYVFNFFTSFGYFNTEAENDQVMRNISQSIKLNGWLMMDYMNAGHAEKYLISNEEKEIDGIIYRVKRWADDTHIHKRIEIDSLQAFEPLIFTERVMKLYLDDFNAMFERNGLKLQKMYGDYGLSEYNRELSPRLILLAQKIAS